MIEVYHLFNDWIISTGIPWWIWAIVGFVFGFAMLAGFEKGMGMIMFLCCYVGLPIYLMIKLDSIIGILLGGLIGFGIMAFFVALTDVKWKGMD